ncbi:GTA-gp10 family protein [Paremcibacter congregatus]|uniref:GTA-gp10 family protein n=1 Tax=Paremcibacter congregatus TaxID=2043170 RepID=UPI0030EE3984
MSEGFKNSLHLRLGGDDYRLRPTFQAIMDMEERLGGLLGLAVRAAEGDFGLKEMTVIIWACMEERLAFDKVGTLILAQGLTEVSPVVRALLTLCLTGAREPSER